MQNPYAKYLGDRDAMTVLEATPGQLRALLAPVLENKAALEQPPAPGKWSIRDILAHLADGEIGFGFRIRQAIANPTITMQPWDQDLWARRYPAYEAAAALDTFAALRQWNVALLKVVTPAELNYVLTHPERGTGPFRTVIETFAGHDLNHLEQLERLTSVTTA